MKDKLHRSQVHSMESMEDNNDIGSVNKGDRRRSVSIGKSDHDKHILDQGNTAKDNSV